VWITLYWTMEVGAMSRGGQINRLPIKRPIININQTDITITDSYQSVIS
jgi:hypothetical protein